MCHGYKECTSCPKHEEPSYTTFYLREAGIEVNVTPKVQLDDPNVQDHSLYFKDGNMRIHLALNGIFSYFNTTKSTAQF